MTTSLRPSQRLRLLSRSVTFLVLSLVCDLILASSLDSESAKSVAVLGAFSRLLFWVGIVLLAGHVAVRVGEELREGPTTTADRPARRAWYAQ